MGSRITIYHVRKNDYKRNINAMGEDKLQEVLDNSKIALKLDRKALSAKLAKFLGLRAGSGQKVSIYKGASIKEDIRKNMGDFITFTVIEEGARLPMSDVHTLTGMGLMIEALSLKSSSKLYGGYYIIYA
ncbi:MAG: hypothetical protein CMA60_00175 [Euryarchaeota archaeon]|nr:hypothetical protein [Euryarchaeota archaeon]|tara:strand:- start:2256 stop:2645 length:390 start_codon:yes stop_codon:yes gene_type:complete